MELDISDGASERTRHERAIYRIWPDFPIKRRTVKSISTVRADAARNSFAAWCKRFSLKALDEVGDGQASNLIAAIAEIQEINGYGRRLRAWSESERWLRFRSRVICVRTKPALCRSRPARSAAADGVAAQRTEPHLSGRR